MSAGKLVEGLTKDETVVKYASLVKYLAQKIAVRLPASIELDDLISAGAVGLMDAFDKFDGSYENKFKTYAEFRIRGAIQDELRSQDWVPRSMREKARALDRADTAIAAAAGRPATNKELCELLEVTPEDLGAIKAVLQPGSILSSEGFAIQDLRARDPDTLLDYKVILDKSHSIRSARARTCLVLYVEWGLTMKEIGHALGVTESRISQLLTQIEARLGLKLQAEQRTASRPPPRPPRKQDSQPTETSPKEPQHGSASRDPIDLSELYRRLRPPGAERLDG